MKLLQISLAVDLPEDSRATNWPVFSGAAVLNRASNIFSLLCFPIVATVTGACNPVCSALF